MSSPFTQAGGAHLARHDGMETGHRSDPYRETGKLPEAQRLPRLRRHCPCRSLDLATGGARSGEPPLPCLPSHSGRAAGR